MLVDDFDYPLPKELIAQRPLPRRDGSRLMVLRGGNVEHRSFTDLPGFLGEGDVLVLNDSRVIPARLHGRKTTGGKAELLLLTHLGRGRWDSTVSGKTLSPGAEVVLDPVGGVEGGGENARATVVETRGGGRYVIQLGTVDILARYGGMPTPPYIKEELEDQGRYQTVYAREDGSVAAPTAGFHFTSEMLRRLSGAGVIIRYVTLHVGISTFATVRSETVEGHAMEPERYTVPEDTAAALNSAGAEGRRVVYVGTTTMKTLESAAGEDGTIRPGSGESDLFIHPGYRLRRPPDLLLTNFHLPRSTLLMLVSAYAGRERILSAYSRAVEEGYRFYSFGDAMLLDRGGEGAETSTPPNGLGGP